MDATERHESGVDRRTMLIAQQSKLWQDLQACRDQRALPAISKELRAVTAELEALPEPSRRTVIDELTARRSARFKDAEDQARTAGDGR